MASGKKNILHIIKSLGRGGAEMLLPETLKLHDQASFEFHYIYFLPWKDQMVESLLTHGGKVTCIQASNNLSLVSQYKKIVAYVRNNDIQIIHAHLPWAGIVARIAGKIAGIPVIYTEHNKQERYHIATRYMNLVTMNLCTRVIAVSSDVERSIKENHKNLKVPVQRVVNGVNTDHFAPGVFAGKDIRTELHIPASSLIIGTIAVFRFQKRLDVWMEIASEISKKKPDVHFIIVGDGPLKSMLLEKRSALGLQNKIHFAGLQTEVRPYLAAFDIFMMSSVFEGLPIALLEAMSSGCSIVSTDAGGIKEVVRHEIDGMLCHVDEVMKLKDLTLRLLDDPLKKKELSANARRRVVEEFGMGKMILELERIYEETLKG